MNPQDSVTLDGKLPPLVRVEIVRPRRWWTRALVVLLLVSALLNLVLLISTAAFVSQGGSPTETFVSGEETSPNKIAILDITGTIMPPMTGRTIKTIEQLTTDDSVKGVVLAIDSPGGLVADSHQIYAKLLKLRDKKPIYVSMKRIAASGGYYVAMAAGPDGKIFAEPTTWTGSIGVIMPRYDISKLASDFGIKSDPLVTGPFKDSLSPFKELSVEDRQLWQGIIDESFERFKQIIDDGRGNLTKDQVATLATGRVFTANQAVTAGLVDQIGFEEDAIDALKSHLKLASVRVIRRQQPATLLDVVLGMQVKSQPVDPLQKILDASTPHAMYFCGWPGMGIINHQDQ